MDFESFKTSVQNGQSLRSWSPALQALWWDAKGDWDRAHDCAQEKDDTASAHVHAYLHRKEGDLSNANYWYRRAGETPSILTLEAEWEKLVRRYLAV